MRKRPRAQTRAVDALTFRAAAHSIFSSHRDVARC